MDRIDRLHYSSFNILKEGFRGLPHVKDFVFKILYKKGQKSMDWVENYGFYLILY